MEHWKILISVIPLGMLKGGEKKDLRPTPYELVLIDVSDPENARKTKKKI